MRLRAALIAAMSLTLLGCSQAPADIGTSSASEVEPSAMTPAVPSSEPSPLASLPPAVVPVLIGLPLGAAQSRAGSAGIAVRPTRVGGGPPEPTCTVVDQRPKPGEVAEERVAEVLIECPRAPGPPSPPVPPSSVE